MPRNELQARVFVSLDKEQRITLIKAVKADLAHDYTTAKDYARLKKQLFPNLCVVKPAKPKPTTVIDVKATTVLEPTIPNISNVVNASEELLEKLDDNEEGDGILAEELRAFLKLAEPVLEYQKRQASKRSKASEETP